MPNFWLDSSMFIEAKNGNLGFDIAPGFWKAMDRKASEGQLASSLLVYHELVDDSDDELSRWAKDRKESRLWVVPDKLVQTKYAIIAEYVAQTYRAEEVAKAFKGADLWIIAHAMAYGGRVVTKESLVNPANKRAKIPNICNHFDIKPANTSDMLRSLKIILSG